MIRLNSSNNSRFSTVLQPSTVSSREGQNDKYGEYMAEQLFMIEPHMDDSAILDMHFGAKIGETSDQLRYNLDSLIQVQFKRATGQPVFSFRRESEGFLVPNFVAVHM